MLIVTVQRITLRREKKNPTSCSSLDANDGILTPPLQRQINIAGYFINWLLYLNAIHPYSLV